MGGSIHIHEQSSMWDKATSWCMILPWLYQAPGHSSPFSCMVASAQSEAPHFMSVPKQFTGQFLCDSRCPMFGAYKICSHTLNSVESFLISCSGLTRPYRKANLTKLSNTGMPAQAGKERGAKGSRRCKMTQSAPPATTQRIQLSKSTSAPI